MHPGGVLQLAGGAHPNTVLLAWNFDLMTGQFFAPEILAADGQIFLDAVRDEIIRQIDMTPEAAVGGWLLGGLSGHCRKLEQLTRSPSMRRG